MLSFLHVIRKGTRSLFHVPCDSGVSEAINYGYALIQARAKVSGGQIEWTEGMLFRVALGWNSSN